LVGLSQNPLSLSLSLLLMFLLVNTDFNSLKNQPTVPPNKTTATVTPTINLSAILG